MGAVPMRAVLVDPSKASRNQTVLELALVDGEDNPIGLADLLTRIEALEEQVFEPEGP